MEMSKVYLLVRLVDSRLVETYFKVFTSESFAKKFCQEVNDCYCGKGTWQVKELSVDTYE